MKTLKLILLWSFAFWAGAVTSWFLLCRDTCDSEQAVVKEESSNSEFDPGDDWELRIALIFEKTSDLLDNELHKNGNLKQADMNQISYFCMTLDEWEKDWLEEAEGRRNGYDEESSLEREKWREMYKAETTKPLPCDGGSIEPMIRGSIASRLITERIKVLKARRIKAAQEISEKLKIEQMDRGLK